MYLRTLSIVMTLTVAFAVLLGGAAEAGLDEWTSHGPFGGSVSVIVTDPVTPTTLYAVAGTYHQPVAGAGLYRSTDAGAHWSTAERGLPDARVQTLAIDPQASATLYAGTEGEGVYRSIDAGEHWSAANDGLPEGTVVEALAIDPQTPSIVFAGASWQGVYRSTDGGAHWSAVNDGLPEDRQVLAVVVDSQTPSTLYVGTWKDGLYRSTDSGASWSAVNNGLPFDEHICCGIEYWPIPLVAIDPQTPTTLYAVASDWYPSGYLYRSTDGGASWSALWIGDDPYRLYAVASLAIDPHHPTTLYAGTDDTFERRAGGIFKSTDGGDHWTQLRYDSPVLALAIDPHSPTTVYAGMNGSGVLRSADAGAHWDAVNHGIINTEVESLAIDPQTPEIVYAGTYGDGVFKSVDRGATWDAVNDGLGFFERTVRALAIDPQSPSTIYAAPEHWLGGMLFKSIDGGAHWSPAVNGLPEYGRSVYALAIDPQTPTTLYAAGDFITDNEEFGVFKSLDGGSHWSAAADGLPRWVLALAIDPQNPDTVYAAPGGAGVFRSDDGGAYWSAVNDGLPDRGDVVALAIDPQTPTTLYAGTGGGGVYRSIDGGTHWQAANSGVGSPVNELVIDPQIPTTLYAGTFGGVFRSTDGGDHWEAVNNGLTHPRVGALAIDPATPSTLYAGTHGGGVYEIQLVSGQRVLPLHEGRFRVEVDWRDFGGATGPGTVAVARSDSEGDVALRSPDSAVARYRNPDNWELMAKVLDGRGLNEHFWVFLAAATTVELDIRVTDTSCGAVRTYLNPLGIPAPAVTDTAAFQDCDTPQPPSCVPGETTFCLGEDGRFQVDATWRDYEGTTGAVREVTLPRTGLARSDDSGVFYFFTEDNWELLVKVLDGCGINDRYWVFAAATTNVEYTLKVTDTESGTVREYFNPLGNAADAVTDTGAFATCP